MQQLMFSVDAEPVSKLRARASHSATSKNGFRMFTPKKTRDYEALIKQACWNAMQREGITQVSTAVYMDCIFRFAVPKSAKSRIGQYHLLKPDLTNLLKAVEDGCNGVLYKDDNCIARVSGTKWWAEESSIEVKFSWHPLGQTLLDDYEMTDKLDGRDLF